MLDMVTSFGQGFDALVRVLMFWQDNSPPPSLSSFSWVEISHKTKKRAEESE